jgi:endonuclease YncB( thermonuclease family)
MRVSLVGLLVAAVTALVIAPAASAKMAPCLGGQPGSKCNIWNARVGPVDDGDTVNVKVNGTKKWLKVRLNGVQAPELHVYKHNHRSGDCGAVKATLRLVALMKAAHKHVRLYAMHKNSRAIGDRTRYRRSIGVKIGGKWTDAGSVLMGEGLALWIPSSEEWAWNGPYSRLAQQAQAAHRNIWNPKYCGPGPASTSPIHMKLKWDAEDNDANNVNGEWVRLTNLDPVKPISLRGWWLRDSYLRTDLKNHHGNKGKGFLFPSNAVIPPLGSIRVHAGHGSNSATELFWGLSDAPFENVTGDKKQVADGGYLYDPKGNIRAFVQYPCRTGSCTDPLAGKVSVSARYQGVDYEWVDVKNISAAPIFLKEYEMESVPWFHEFGAQDVLQPGKAITLLVQNPQRVPIASGTPPVLPVKAGVPPFRDTQAGGFRPFAWGNHGALFGDKKDVVTLRNPMGAPVTCAAWGGEHCPGV